MNVVARRRRRLWRRSTPPTCLIRAITTVVLNLGMGVESSTILLRWLLEPETITSPLRKLIVLSAQVGAEGKRTRDLMEQVIYPLLCQHRIRTVQVARGGPTEADGIVVLDDTRQPTTCHTQGHYTLQDELLLTGTVPQYAKGQRRCSLKYKGSVLDRWLAAALGKKKFIQVMGFNAEEQERIARDRSFATVQRTTLHPLNEWGWGRQRCEDYLLEVTKKSWPKSMCSYCPFTGGREHLLERFRTDPDEAALALLIEFVSLALNPRMTLFSGGRSLRSVVEADDRLGAARARFAEELQRRPWALYEVRRVFYAPGVADRKVEALATGSYEEMVQAIAERAAQEQLEVEVNGEYRRVHPRRRVEASTYPMVEHMLTIAPSTVADKSRKRFNAAWAAATNPYQQQALF
jgi:hypothetical protein